MDSAGPFALPAAHGEARLHNDLRDMLAGVEATLSAEGCTVAGGHAATAVEHSLGFAVSGLAKPTHCPAAARGPMTCCC